LLYLPNYGLLLGAVCLLALIGQMYRPASATLLSVLTPENRQVMIFAMYRFGLNLGATAAPLIGFGLYNLGNKSYRLLFWGEALIALAYAFLAWAALPGKSATSGGSGSEGASGESEGVASGYRAMLRDRRYTFYLIATFLNSAVYVQYLSTLPLDVKASHVKTLWYVVAVSLNGAIVIAFELPLTKISQHWPYKVTISAAFLLVGAGVAFYGLPIGPAVILIGTLIWTLGEIVGAPAAFAYPGIAGPAHLKARYIGSFQFMFGLGAAVGPMAGAALLTHLHHRVWPVIALVAVLAFLFGLLGVRQPQKSDVPEAEEPSTVAAG
jgi:hypothetical protein